MQPLTNCNIESELSYAYLHAVVSSAGASCQIGTRHDDNTGVDAKITGWGPFPYGGYLTEIDLKIQLKATIKTPTVHNGYFSFYLNGKARYDDLRQKTLATHRLLVVMFLPDDTNDWLTISQDELILRKCAYWVSLKGAPDTTNTSGQTVYIPIYQTFTPTSLLDIFARLSRGETLTYSLP